MVTNLENTTAELLKKLVHREDIIPNVSDEVEIIFTFVEYPYSNQIH